MCDTVVLKNSMIQDACQASKAQDVFKVSMIHDAFEASKEQDLAEGNSFSEDAVNQTPRTASTYIETSSESETPRLRSPSGLSKSDDVPEDDEEEDDDDDDEDRADGADHDDYYAFLREFAGSFDGVDEDDESTCGSEQEEASDEEQEGYNAAAAVSNVGGRAPGTALFCGSSLALSAAVQAGLGGTTAPQPFARVAGQPPSLPASGLHCGPKGGESCGRAEWSLSQRRGCRQVVEHLEEESEEGGGGAQSGGQPSRAAAQTRAAASGATAGGYHGAATPSAPSTAGQFQKVAGQVPPLLAASVAAAAAAPSKRGDFSSPRIDTRGPVKDDYDVDKAVEHFAMANDEENRTRRDNLCELISMKRMQARRLSFPAVNNNLDSDLRVHYGRVRLELMEEVEKLVAELAEMGEEPEMHQECMSPRLADQERRERFCDDSSEALSHR
jgi:hypothetical protein